MLKLNFQAGNSRLHASNMTSAASAGNDLTGYLFN